MMIAIVGMAGAGKTEAVRYFVDQKGFSKVYMGSPVLDGLKAQGLPWTQEHEKRYREDLRQKHGMAAMAILLASQISALRQQTNKVLLESLYSWEEYQFLKERFPELVLVVLFTRPTFRYQRLEQRKERPLTIQEARQRDIAEIVGTNKGGPIAIADFLIVNEGTIEELYEKLQIVYHEIEQGQYYPSTSPAKRDGAGLRHAAEQPTSH